MGLPVTRANPAKAFRESAVVRSSSSSILLSLIEALNRRKPLMVAISRGGDPSSRRPGSTASGTSTADWPSELRPPAFERSCSREAIHLLDTVNTVSRREQIGVLYALVVVFQSTILIVANLRSTGLLLPLTILGSVDAMSVAFGSRFLSQLFRRYVFGAHIVQEKVLGGVEMEI